MPTDVLYPGLSRPALDPRAKAACLREVIAAAIHKDFQSAVNLVRHLSPNRLGGLAGDQLFRIGVAFYQKAELEHALRCLELAADRTGPWQHKAMLLVGCTYEALGDRCRAVGVIRNLLDRHPEDLFRRQALERLVKLQQKKRSFSGDTHRNAGGAFQEGVATGNASEGALAGGSSSSIPIGCRTSQP